METTTTVVWDDRMQVSEKSDEGEKCQESGGVNRRQRGRQERP